jgi:hypothetical protein
MQEDDFNERTDESMEDDDYHFHRHNNRHTSHIMSKQDGGD